MRLYKITFNNRSWQTTSPSEAWGFIFFLFHDGTFDLSDPKEVSKRGGKLRSTPYTGPEITSVIVG